MRSRDTLTFAAATLLALTLAPAAPAQQPASAPPQTTRDKTKPPAKKVWTDDDLAAVRKPWDEYADQEARAEQAAAATKAPEKTPLKKEKPVVRDAYLPPKTVEEAESRLTLKQREINYQLESMDRVRKESANETNEQVREAMKQKLEGMKTDLNESQAHLKLLQADLQDLRSKSQPPQAPAADAASQSPSSQPPL